MRLLIFLTLFTLGIASACAESQKSLPAQYQRIAFLGDSITDGFTYPLLLRQTLVDAGFPAPVLINAGVGGDTAPGMLARLDRDVLAYKPTLVMLSVGLNDSNTYTDEQFQKNVEAICDRFDAAKLPVMILTTSTPAMRWISEEGKVRRFNAILRKIAEARSYPLADVWATMDAARRSGESLNEADGWHLSDRGYHFMVRAVLDAMGYGYLPGPAALRVAPMPGLITNWRIYAYPTANAPGASPPAAAAALSHTGWIDGSVPETATQAGWFKEQLRCEGYVMDPLAKLGLQGQALAAATINLRHGRSAYLNTGGSIKSLWLNGKSLPIESTGCGYLIGGRHLAVTLHRGVNNIVVVADGFFIVTCTTSPDCF